jgi:hypothetical protein
LLKERCLYTHVFETHLLKKYKEQTHKGTTPHPFVLVPPLSEQNEFRIGDTFSFGLILFGAVNLQMTYFIHVIQRMGAFGIGKGRSRGNGRLLLQQASESGRVVFSNDGQRMKVEACGQPFFLLPTLDGHMIYPEGEDRIDTVRVSFVTPFRFKHDNRLKHHLPFHLLVRAALRRVAEIYALFGDGEPSLDYSGIVRQAELVRVKESNIEWKNWQRFSQRQNRSMEMGGMVGETVYQGNLAPFMPLLDLSARFHLGKQTSFGFGKLVYKLN